jgi:hypothetical protein
MLIRVLLDEHAGGLGVRVLGESCVSLGGLRCCCYLPCETSYRSRGSSWIVCIDCLFLVDERCTGKLNINPVGQFRTFARIAYEQRKIRQEPGRRVR